jgi:hypothetical protein
MLPLDVSGQDWAWAKTVKIEGVLQTLVRSCLARVYLQVSELFLKITLDNEIA